MYSRVNEKLLYVIDITVGINESIFCGNDSKRCNALYSQHTFDFVVDLPLCLLYWLSMLFMKSFCMVSF